jgi:acetolactate synthase-1/2/3 large subunit
MKGSGGALLVETLRHHGIDTLFTLNGGHLFPVYDACTRQGLRVIDVRHEQTAVFAARPHRGPVFLDVPVDLLFQSAEAPELSPTEAPTPPAPDPELIATVSSLLAEARSPVLVAGSDLTWAGAWEELRTLAEAVELPVYGSGLGRGSLPTGHPLALSRSRSLALRAADLVIVVGTPLDFRLGFGDFGAARVVHLVDAPEGNLGAGPSG